MRRRCQPYLIVAGLGLLFFSDLLLQPLHLLYADHSDLIALYIPPKQFLAAEWQRTGELPLWCPYRFAGMPFVHDIQTGAFYPPNFVLYAVPPQHMGAALSWLTVAHVIVAGWCMLAYAQGRGLTMLPALTAAVGYMFSGPWLSYLLLGGSYLTVGTCWLPLALLWLEEAVERRSMPRATAAGCVFALLILGAPPQLTFYAGVFLALWTLAPALENAGYLGGSGDRSWPRTGTALGLWLGLGVWSVVVAAGLSAIQLLPTLELTAASSRAGGFSVDQVRQISASGRLTLVNLMGPAGSIFTGAEANLRWEDRGSLAFLWVVAALLAPLVVGTPRVRFQLAVCVGIVVFAIGGAILLQPLPGFRLFRRPSRSMIIIALPLAYLAAVSSAALFAQARPSAEVLHRCRRVLLRVLVVLALLAGGFALRNGLEGRPPAWHIYWLTLLVTAPLAYRLLGPVPAPARARAAGLWAACLLVDVWALAAPFVVPRPEDEVCAAPASVQYLAGRPGRVLDFDEPPPGLCSGPLGAGAPLALPHRIEAVRGYSSLDVLRFKEYLGFIADDARPLAACDGSGLTDPVIVDIPVRNRGLLDLLGVRSIVQASVPDQWHPGWKAVFHDPQPVVYDFLAGGLQTLPPYTVYENEQVMPAAFVVPEAGVLPGDRAAALAALKATNFRERVLLEDWQPSDAGSGAGSSFAPAALRRPTVNQVVIDAVGPGYLVLTDPWFPGWQCTIDGAPTRVYRANYLFRAVNLPAGRHEVVFTFAPDSLAWGRRITLATLALVSLLGLICGVRGWRRRAASAPP